MSQSTVALPSDASASALPYHVLMVPSPDQQLQRRRLFEQRLEKDYISRRFKALNEDPSNQELVFESNSATNSNNGNESQPQQPPPLPPPTLDVWKGTSDVERSLVECCEVPTSWEEAANGGALAKGKEIAFLGILASCCNDVGTRALALAILERTIRKDEKELEDDQQPRFEEEQDDNNDGATTSKHGANNDEAEDESKAGEGDDEADNPGVMVVANACSDDGATNDSTEKPSESIDASMDTSNSIPQSVVTQEIQAEDEPPTPTSEVSTEESAENGEERNVKRGARNIRHEELGRMDVFLAAGGLTLLNNWFKEAISPVVFTPRASSSASAASKRPQAPPKSITKPAPTGPILLVLLSVLEKIPFDKKLVMETKINKQIRKLSKHVDAILKSAEASADLTDPVAGGLSVVEVKNAVDALKETWEEQASGSKNSEHNATVADPFAELKKKMAERLELLQRYEAGDMEKPDWLARFDQPDKSDEHVSKKPKVKTSMTVLQARERQQECMALTRKLKEAQREKVKILNQLRERRRKNEDEAEKAPARRKTTKSKKVTWKDGITFSNDAKLSKLLEQWHRYDPYEFDDDQDVLMDNPMRDAEEEATLFPLEDLDDEMNTEQEDPTEEEVAD